MGNFARRGWIQLLAVGTLVSPGATQEMAMVERSPRFLYAASPTTEPKVVDGRRIPVLHRRIALHLNGATLREALAAITEQTGLHFVYSRDETPVVAPVHVR